MERRKEGGREGGIEGEREGERERGSKGGKEKSNCMNHDTCRKGRRGGRVNIYMLTKPLHHQE